MRPSLLFRAARLTGLALLAGLAVRPAQAQVSFSNEALEELRSLSITVDVVGAGVDGGQLEGLLAGVIRQELRRADILFEQAEPRAGDCCILRLDARVTTGSGRARFGVAYTVRLELGFSEVFGTVPVWTTVWAGRMLGNIVERPELIESLRFTARELAGDFVDRYRERFPIRE